MTDYRTEEEQIELLKKWWKENGRSTVVGVVIALLLFFGWTQWQAYQKQKTEAASDLFQQMMQSSESVDSGKKVTAIAEQIRKEYPQTAYAVFAALRLAKDAVVANNLPSAVQFLEWAQQRNTDAGLKPLIALRMAQVQYAQNELDRALTTLSDIKSIGAAWSGAVAELRGDILVGQNKLEEARASYQSAKQIFDTAGNQERNAAVEVKLSTLPASTKAEPGK